MKNYYRDNLTHVKFTVTKLWFSSSFCKRIIFHKSIPLETSPVLGMYSPQVKIPPLAWNWSGISVYRFLTDTRDKAPFPHFKYDVIVVNFYICKLKSQFVDIFLCRLMGFSIKINWSKPDFCRIMYYWYCIEKI